jgi:hypothetical protein
MFGIDPDLAYLLLNFVDRASPFVETSRDERLKRVFKQIKLALEEEFSDSFHALAKEIESTSEEKLLKRYGDYYFFTNSGDCIDNSMIQTMNLLACELLLRGTEKQMQKEIAVAAKQVKLGMIEKLREELSEEND